MTNQEQESLPLHVGIIMDGNGRWAQKRGLPRSAGHKQGALVFRKIVRHAADLGIPVLTVYAFSTENWKRPRDEVAGLMSLMRSYLRDMERYKKENIKVRIIGDISVLDEDIRRDIQKLEEGSAGGARLTLNIAVSYGGRAELVMAARELARRVRDGRIPDVEAVDDETLESLLYTAGQPDVDLILRTGGERRLSNFLLWQSAYAEYVFTETLWPDFTPKHLDEAIAEFSRRTRRMGGI